jgi:hypothetical protein
LRKPERGDFAISKLVEIRLYFIEAADAGDSAPIVCSYSPDLDLTKESQFLRERGL